MYFIDTITETVILNKDEITFFVCSIDSVFSVLHGQNYVLYITSPAFRIMDIIMAKNIEVNLLDD